MKDTIEPGAQWRLTVRGVRGSAPRPSPECMEYGGNTSCFTLERDGRLTVLDCGSGLSALGRRPCGHPVRAADVLISHLHLDHIQGLVSFPLLFDPEAEIRFTGCAGMETHIRRLLSPPFWPVGMDGFAARLSFREVRPGDRFALGGFTVSAAAGNHPGGSLMYRLEADGKSLTYALDCELTEPFFPALADFARGSGWLIWDAHFAPGRLQPGWGHSTWRQGMELGRAAEAGNVLMTHYHWDYTDEFLRREEASAAECTAEHGPSCRFAREGMEILL